MIWFKLYYDDKFCRSVNYKYERSSTTLYLLFWRYAGGAKAPRRSAFSAENDATSKIKDIMLCYCGRILLINVLTVKKS